jgi:hypothetical protein
MTALEETKLMEADDQDDEQDKKDEQMLASLPKSFDRIVELTENKWMFYCTIVFMIISGPLFAYFQLVLAQQTITLMIPASGLELIFKLPPGTGNKYLMDKSMNLLYWAIGIALLQWVFSSL